MTHSFPMLITLNREWTQLEQTGAQFVADWAAAEPSLADCHSLTDVLQAAQQRPDAVFATLLRLGADGAGSTESATVARRVILQSLLGLLVRLAKGRPQVFEEAVTEAWLLIAEYPLARRPRSIVANLAWSLRRWAAEQGDSPRQPTALPIGGLLTEPASPTIPEPELDAADTLTQARRLGLIDPLTHQTLVSVYLVGKTSAEAGRDLGLSAQAVRWRCSNALRNLQRQAVLLAG